MPYNGREPPSASTNYAPRCGRCVQRAPPPFSRPCPEPANHCIPFCAWYACDPSSAHRVVSPPPFFKYLLRPDVRKAAAASLETPPERTEQQQRPKKSEQDGAAAAAVPPSTAAVPALESRKQEQNLLVHIASGEDTLLLKKEILEHTEQHGPLERAGLAAALQAGAAARGAGSAAAAAPVPAAAGLMAATGLKTAAARIFCCDARRRSASFHKSRLHKSRRTAGR